MLFRSRCSITLYRGNSKSEVEQVYLDYLNKIASCLSAYRRKDFEHENERNMLYEESSKSSNFYGVVHNKEQIDYHISCTIQKSLKNNTLTCRVGLLVSNSRSYKREGSQ